jgi:2-haloacid dehalogenase
MNVVFDIGNVLLRWDPRFLYRKIFADEERMEWFLTHVCSPDWNLEQDRGRSFDEAVQHLATKHPEYSEEISAFHMRWHETAPGVIEGTVDILEQLSEQGTPLYAITNFSVEKFAETRARYGFFKRFQDILVSGEVRLIKPDPAIYQLFLERNRLNAESCLFIDDSEKNVAGAKAVGMKAVHFQSPEMLKEELHREGLFT